MTASAARWSKDNNNKIKLAPENWYHSPSLIVYCSALILIFDSIFYKKCLVTITYRLHCHIVHSRQVSLVKILGLKWCQHKMKCFDNIWLVWRHWACQWSHTMDSDLRFLSWLGSDYLHVLGIFTQFWESYYNDPWANRL